jgi:phosphate transport system permease protein
METSNEKQTCDVVARDPDRRVVGPLASPSATNPTTSPGLRRRWQGPLWLSIEAPVRFAVVVSALLILLLLGGILWALYDGSKPAIERFGWHFLSNASWNPVTEDFGALSSIFGTLVSTLIALLIAVPMSLVIALFLVELAPSWLSSLVGGAIELLAAIPSIIFGMWGLFVLAPFLAENVEPPLKKLTGEFPLFSGPPTGIGMLSAGLVLALMILPFIAAISRDIFRSMPKVLREAAYGLGATTWEVTWNVTLRYGRRGILGAAFLGLGRAVGETMAVTFVIGNTHDISMSLFAAGNTISSTLANEFSEASDALYLSSLIELGLVLLVITLVVQCIAQVWIFWISGMGGGER